ncbi:hypothetical protein [Terrisporobacter mayombei]|uniref:hypothetical protein n=1 Tax=Terrisporobacter mayombei TaxID=1541 RepID=UPI00265AB9B3|nr:hypothetical protein [Terrisporobacter mayombei]MCC3668639.1 hypothetical protein [Terrisporobacter mayombei]
MAKKKITVICNYPTPENMDKFQDIMCNELAKGIIASKPVEYVEALKAALKKDLEKSLN